MNIKEQVQEILRELSRLHPTVIADDTVSNAFTKIHALYLAEFERLLPKKQKHPKGYEQEEDYLTQIRIGWNQCLENIRFKIEELRKEK